MKKRNLLFIVFTVVAIICISAITVFATTLDSAPALRIAKNTLELKNAVFMNFKVSSENIDDTSAIKLLVWEEPPTEYTKDTAVSTLYSIRTESDTGYIVFQYDDLAAKDMTKLIYVCAYAEVDGEEIYSKPVKFSIYQYAYNALNSESYPENLKNLLSGMLQYGAYAQTYFNYNTDFLATDTVAKIKVVNGKHADGFTTGYYKAGTSVTLTANNAEDGYAFSHWIDSTGNVVGTENTLTISDCISETYTAEYRNATSAIEYRYRDKQYTTSTTELEAPWILYDQHTEIEHGSTIKVYLEKDEAIDTDEYCVHYKTLVCKYMHPTNSTYKWVNSSSTDHYYYHTVGDWQYWHYGDYYCYTCCSVDSKTSVTEYYYYSWGDWSEWSDTPITATDDREVEVRGVFTVTYDANGGVNAPNAQTKPVGEDIVISSSIPTREGHIFKGWSTTSNGAVEYRAEDIYSIDSNITLYAVWQAYTYTITYNANGGENVPQMQIKTYGIDIVLSSTIPTRQGYTFVGWATSENGDVTYNADDIYSVNNNLNLYAIWEVIDTSIIIASGICGENLTWTLSERGTLFIDGSGTMSDYSTVKTKAPWYEYASTINTVIISDNITSIGSYAFWDCSSISSVTIGNSVTNIKEGAFLSCKMIGNIIIPDSVAIIGAQAFRYCSNLTSVTLGSSVKSMGDYAFNSCERLISISIPNSMTYISQYTFSECINLKRIAIPPSITTIYYGAFDNCNSLEEVHIKDIAKWCSVSFYSYTSNPLFYAHNLFLNNDLVTELIIPESVKVINNYAFKFCHSLTSVTVTKNVESIGNHAFYGCTNLTEVIFEETDGWQYYKDSYEDSREGYIYIYNDSSTITYLIETYSNYWWKRA